MKRLKILIIFSILLVIIFSCQTTVVKKEVEKNQDPQVKLPGNLWLSESTHTRLDSIFDYYNQAKKKLSDRDTLGAEIYFNYAFEIISKFTDEDQITLENWTEYDSTFKSMNEEYAFIYLSNNHILEAEEIREDITELEELTFPDSILFGNGVVVDTSGSMPITINNKVRLAIKYFQTTGRVVMTRWLERSGKYEPMIKEILRKKNLPNDLFYLAMIESGFVPRARSYARAVGIWQFISATGRAYGLRNNWWFDERRDVLKSTHAAAEHLSDLHDRFGDWYLAMSGYNCNPNKVARNMRRYKTRDFWKLTRLPRQTRNYVPTFLAATIIAKDPKKFGFYIEPQKALEMDSVQISESLDLNVIAKLVDTSYVCIKELNPAVLRWVTPPGVKDFTLYLPKGKKAKFKEGYAKIPDNQKRSWVRHRIKQGEALSTIAKKYHTSISVLRSTNKLRSNRIRAGKYLLIPVPQNKSHYYTYKTSNYSSSKKKRRSRAIVKNVPGSKKIIHIVKAGETLGGIAEDYKTRASKIRAWNGIRYGRYIYPKQKLAIWVPEDMEEIKQKARKKIVKNQGSGSYYTVRRGDTLWDIAKKYGLSIRDLKKMNNMRSSFIKPGKKLKVSDN